MRCVALPNLVNRSENLADEPRESGVGTARENPEGESGARERTSFGAEDFSWILRERAPGRDVACQAGDR